MSEIFRFNAHDMDEATVRRLSTGRETEVEIVLDMVAANLAAGAARSHALIKGPRGYGKSFLMRLLQIQMLERGAAGERLGVALLAEEQMNVNAPDLLLREIRRVFLGEAANSVLPQWDRSGLWEQARADLDGALDAAFGVGQGLLVAMVENLDLLLNKAFPERADQAGLRKWLNDPTNRVMLVAGSASGSLDNSPAAPLFKQFTPVELHGWDEADCISYLHKQIQERGRELTGEREAKARAIATFIGGNPRLSVILGDVLLNDDALSTAALLDRLVDELTPYYQDRIASLGGRAQSLLDALLRGGEPCSQSALATRVGARQPDIARAFNELQSYRLVVGERAKDGKETLYRIEDRVFAHYYRKRHILHGQGYSPFEAIAEFLKLYFDNDEKRRHAMELAERGQVREARFLLALAEQERRIPHGEKTDRRATARTIANRCLTAIGRISPEWRDWLAPDVNGITEKGADLAAISARLNQQPVSASVSSWHSLLLAIAHYLAGNDTAVQIMVQKISQDFQRDGNRFGQTTSFLFLARLFPTNAPECLTCLNAAVETATLDADLDGQATASGWLAWTLGRSGRHEEALAAADHATGYARQANRLGWQADALCYAAWSLGQLGRYEEAVAAASAAGDLARGAGRSDVQAISLRYAAWSLGQLGRFEEAVAAASEAADLAHSADIPDEQAISLRYAAWNLGRLKRYDEAVAAADMACQIATTIGDAGLQAEGLWIAGWCLNELGRHDEAITRSRAAIDLAVLLADGPVATYALFLLIDSAAALMRDDDVIGAARQWLDLAPRFAGQEGVLPIGHCLPHLVPALLRRNRWAVDMALLRAVWDSAEVWVRTEAGFWAAHAAVQLADSQGRAVAFAALAACLRTLAGAFAPLSQTLLHELAVRVSDPGLLSDLADLVRAELPGQVVQADLLAAAALYHAGGRDPASLQRVDPDIALAIRRVWPAAEGPKPVSAGRKKKKAG